MFSNHEIALHVILIVLRTAMKAKDGAALCNGMVGVSAEPNRGASRSAEPVLIYDHGAVAALGNGICYAKRRRNITTGAARANEHWLWRMQTLKRLIISRNDLTLDKNV
jgi:hypothetical protein